MRENIFCYMCGDATIYDACMHLHLPWPEGLGGQVILRSQGLAVAAPGSIELHQHILVTIDHLVEVVRGQGHDGGLCMCMYVCVGVCVRVSIKSRVHWGVYDA